MTNDKQKGQLILDDYHYQVKMMMGDQYFKDSIDQLLNRFESFNCPVPRDGFKKYDEYSKWNDKYWNKFAEIRYGKKYKDNFKRITQEKKSWGLDVQNKIEEFENNFLPPIYGRYFEEILNHFNIVNNRKGFHDFLINYVFFKKTEYPHPSFNITWRRNKKSNEPELYLRIFGYTKKEDIEKYWPEIEKEKKMLPDYHGKSKERKNFDRDLQIFKLYKEIKSRKTAISKNKGEEIYCNKRIDEEIYSIINGQYGDLEWENIRKIITKMRRLEEKFVTPK